MATAILIPTTSRYKLLNESHSMLLQRRDVCGTRASSAPGPLHHSRRRSILLEFFGHKLHKRIDVMKEMLVARAEIVQPVLAGCRLSEAVLGTLSITGKSDIALATIGG